MIDITTMVDHIEGFNRNDFTYYRFEKALLERDCQQTEDGWFDRGGEFIAKDTRTAAIKLSLQGVCEKIEANKFYAVQPGSQITRQAVVKELHGVNILGVRE